MYKNSSLKEFETVYNIESIEKLEAIGIEAYSKYGHDFYNYSVAGSPVDIKAVHEYLVKYGLSYLQGSVEDLTIALLDAIENEA